MSLTRRLLEPELDVSIYDDEHVLIVARVPRSQFGTLELVVERAALAPLALAYARALDAWRARR